MPKRENYAIAEIAGQQVILEPGKKVKVPKLDLKQGAKFKADKIMYLRQKDQIEVGQPYLKNIHINTVVTDHDRDDKVIVFKKKRRNRYQIKKGHRQPYTLLEVKDFTTATPKTTAKKEPKAKTAAKKTAQSTTRTKTKSTASKSKPKTNAQKKTSAPKKTSKSTRAKSTGKSAKNTGKTQQTKEKK